ncbi:MAG: hypothetical protein WDM71_01645 [Ferruginibacter sp.]
MKRFIFFLFLLIFANTVFAAIDTVNVPFQHRIFRDKIKEEQQLCDKADGKLDGVITVSNDDEINLQVTDALTRKINVLADSVETNAKINGSNEKIRYLTYIEQVVKNFRTKWKDKTFNPVLAPTLVDNFDSILEANVDTLSMAPYIAGVPYEVGKINSEIFNKNVGYAESKKILFIKYCALHPDQILNVIGPYVNEPFADSLIVVATLRNPVQLYSYAQAYNSPEGKLIHRSDNPLVKAVAELSQTPNALFYFPFLDNILKGKITIDSIKKYVGTYDNNGEKDSIGYYKLLVKTEIEYNLRLIAKDTPIAMFGSNGLRDMLHRKAMEHFITYINGLHEENNLAIRMKAINPLSAIDIYYMIVTCEDEIYTSSYKHSFDRLLLQMGKDPRGDSLLMNVNLDYFKRFIKMAANYNQLDDFLKLMPKENSEVLMKAFVANLDNSGTLEDAVDVADSYSSIKNKALLKTILDNVTLNEQKSIDNNNSRGKIIYGLLKTIFLSEDSSNNIDLTKAIGIPPIYTVDHNYIADNNDRIIEQIFFYGDKDGKGYFGSFLNSFSPELWKITMKKEWVEIKSLKGKQVWIYANRPLDSDQNLDDSAQFHLNNYLFDNDLNPSIVIHRGHSYWLPRTIERMPLDAKIVVLGSCGGYQNLSQILEISPEAHIISTKEIGKGDINMPILNYLNNVFISGKTLVWKDMWATLTKTFSANPNKDVRDSWDDYVPPYKNLGAIFIKAYDKQKQ